MDREIRAIFISDVHLGCRYAQSEALLAFLKGKQPEFVYVVGDFVDGWRLKRGWYWDDTYSFIVKRFVNMMKRGAKIVYTPGNHDEFLRSFISNLGSVKIADEVIHETADGRRLLVMHGDQFDVVVRHARWLSLIGDVGYDVLLWINRVFNFLRRSCGFGYWSLSGYIKSRVKKATFFVSNFEEILTRYARSQGCDGVICGHIHTPAMRERNGIMYYNTGDWVENCTALVEYHDGTFEILHRPLHYGVHGNLDDLRVEFESDEQKPAPLDPLPARDLEEVLS